MKNWYDFYNQSGSIPSNRPISDEEIPLRLNEIKREENRLIAEKGRLIEKGMHSFNPDVLMKAHSAWHDVQVKSDDNLGKSVLIDPNKWNDVRGYKRKPMMISGTVLRRMSRQAPVVKSIITTRQTQVSAFAKPQPNKYDTGFVIRKKRDYYSTEEPKVSAADKKQIKYLTDFLKNGGDENNAWYADNFDMFLKKIVEDSLVLDAGTFEVVRNRKGSPVKFFAVDGNTIRLADSYDDEAYGDRDESDDFYQQERQEERGYYPSYVQIIEDNIEAEYYPWELCFGIRNASTDIKRNGYGRSELEDLVNIVTWMLYGDAYNGNFFTQGASPKGFLKVSGNVNRNRLAQFRQSWQAMVAGVENAWKAPVIESDSMEWVDLQKSNTDMQFSQWQEYLVKIACAIYKIAPEEIGFAGGSGTSGGGLFEGNNEARLKYSRDKGLRPLLKQIEFWINKFLVNPIDDEFEFAFVGLDTETEEKEVDLIIKKATNFMGYKEARRAMDLPDELEEGDFPLNSVYVQMQQQQQFAGEQEENTDFVEEEGGEDTSVWDSLPDTAKAIAVETGNLDNPFMFDAMDYYTNTLMKGDDH